MSTPSDYQTWTVTEPWLNIKCLLAEGPYYEKATHSLRFVDIKQKRLHSLDLAKAGANPGPAAVETLQLDTPVGVTADIEGVDPRAQVLAGLKYGMAVLDRRTGAYEYVNRFPSAGSGNDDDDRAERLRSNDGAVDPHGRLWLGSMTDFGKGPFRPEGALHLFTGKKPTEVKRSSIVVPNGISWSPDGKTMYFSETASGVVQAYDYDAAGGAAAIANARDFYRHVGAQDGGRPGAPDGHRMDVEGNIWQAMWGGSCVLKISPAGQVIGEVKLPTRNITCVQFVGTELFITSAALEGDQEGDATAQEVELAGALFRVDVGVKGVEPTAFRMDAA